MAPASYQQRIPLKGTEDSIDYFTNILRATKSSIGVNSAEVLLKAMIFWHNSSVPLLNKHECSAGQRNCCGRMSRIFYLQVLTTPDVMEQINSHLDRVRRGYALKSLLDSQHVGRAEFLLEALIFILEVFKECHNQLSSSNSASSSVDGYQIKARPSINGHYNLTSVKPAERPTPSRNCSEEPSLSLTPARFGSVGRDEGFEFPSRQWRSVLREQKLAENRRLLESVNQRKWDHNQNNINYHNYKNVQAHENKTYNWLPVHELAINRHSKMDNFKPSSNIYDRNNNNVNQQESPRLQKRREFSEPPVQFQSRKRLGNACHVEQIISQEKQPKKTMISTVRQKYAKIEEENAPILTLKERKSLAETFVSYLNVRHPDLRPTPGFNGPMSNHERIREGIDCDEVFPGIVLGNGATVKKKDYLKRIGITHILNAAEYRGVNVGQDYFNQLGDDFQYFGIRIEDTPQTQICRHFVDAVEFMDDAILQNGKVFVNCVFGKSRSTTFVLAYMMICHHWTALDALRHLRQKRPVQLNPGFLLQIIDLDYKLKWQRMN